MEDLDNSCRSIGLDISNLYLNLLSRNGGVFRRFSLIFIGLQLKFIHCVRNLSAGSLVERMCRTLV